MPAIFSRGQANLHLAVSVGGTRIYSDDSLAKESMAIAQMANEYVNGDTVSMAKE